MRDNIYYWKCDSPGTLASKRQSFFKEKYDNRGLHELVRRVCGEVLETAIQKVEPIRADGNHTAFIVHSRTDTFFFRADDGEGDDDYMLAEKAVMEMAAAGGVPVPRVIHTDISRTVCPFRFQIMECVAEPRMDDHHKAATMDVEAVAAQLGRYLKRLHAIKLDGYGFVDTDWLVHSGRLRGLDKTYRSYFHKRLDDHLDYLRRFELLSGRDCDEIPILIERHEALFNRPNGVLTHRDMALWNVLGDVGRISVIIDWDDAVSGDPADDLGILQCFYDEQFMRPLRLAYWGHDTPEPEAFTRRVWLHTLRNMLWKTKLRHALGYFDKSRDFFLNVPGIHVPLREHTLNLLTAALEKVRSFDTP